MQSADRQIVASNQNATDESYTQQFCLKDQSPFFFFPLVSVQLYSGV